MSAVKHKTFINKPVEEAVQSNTTKNIQCNPHWLVTHRTTNSLTTQDCTT